MSSLPPLSPSHWLSPRCSYCSLTSSLLKLHCLGGGFLHHPSKCSTPLSSPLPGTCLTVCIILLLWDVDSVQSVGILSRFFYYYTLVPLQLLGNEWAHCNALGRRCSESFMLATGTQHIIFHGKKESGLFVFHVLSAHLDYWCCSQKGRQG